MQFVFINHTSFETKSLTIYILCNANLHHAKVNDEVRYKSVWYDESHIISDVIEILRSDDSEEEIHVNGKCHDLQHVMYIASVLKPN
jgi:hypothetical protein